MRCCFAVLTAALLACFTFPALAADESSTTTGPVVATPESKLGADRLTMSIGTPALGGLWIDGQDGHSFSGLSDRTPALAGDVEYGHVFTPWMELGVGFEAQHQIGSSLGAYRPYAFARAFATLTDAEIGFALRAGPTWFHFDVGEEGYTLASIAPSAVVDARVWISPRVALVASLEALVSGALLKAPGASGYVDGSQVWDVTTIASLGVSFRL